MDGKSARARWTFLLASLAGAAGLAVFGDRGGAGRARDGDVVQPAPRTSLPARLEGSPALYGNGAAKPAPAVLEPLLGVAPRAAPAPAARRPAADLFAAPAWAASPARRGLLAAPAAAAPAAKEPAPASAPDPGFRVLGKKHEGSRWEVYLGRDDVTHIARIGEIIESAWRVQRIAPPTMTLLHLPTNQERSLPIGEAR